MARYNSVLSTASIAGGNTIYSPASGLLTTLTGSGTVTIPNPTLYTGQSQTFYNSTGSALTLSTPSGLFTGPGTGNSSSLSLAGGSVLTVVSDGTNYIAQGWLGGAITVNGTLTANGTVAINPTNANVSIQPTGTGTLNLSSGTTGSLDNVTIGTTTAVGAKFTTLSASGVTQVTANTAVTLGTAASGALQVTGGVGVGGGLSVGGSGYFGGYLNLVSTVNAYLSPNTSAIWTSGITGAGSFGIGTSNNYPLTFGVNNVGQMILNTSGQLGLGTSSPLGTLDISGAGNAYLTNKTTSPANSQSAPGSLYFSGLGWNTLSGSTQYQAQIALGGSYSGSSGSVEPAITFSLAGTGNSGYNASAGPNTLTERLRINNYGNVGFSNASPAVSLDMSTRTDAIALPKGTGAQRPTAAAGYLRYSTDSTSPEYYNGSAWISLGARDGTSASKAALKSTDILLYNSSAPTGWYWLSINGTATQVYIDNVYNGGGWVLVATHPINVSIPSLTYAQTTTGITQLGSSGFVVGSGDPKQYATFMPLRQWTYITTANSAGGNFVMFTAGSNQELGATGNHSRRTRWTWTGWGSLYTWQGITGLTNEVGGSTPGLYGYATTPYNWSTYDNDQDSYSGNCSQSYNNAPWWYNACWDGSFWGGNGSGYQNASFWTGSGSDYYSYGAMYIK